MDKSLFVNEIIFSMQGHIDNKTSEFLRNVLYTKLKDVTITEQLQLPSVDLYSNEIATLQACCTSLTKMVIPADNVCPKPMPQYNSWTAPTNP